jgi:hypothetical protein
VPRSDSKIIPARPSEIATPESVIGAVVEEISMRCGTYGMGGPGFAGLRIGTDRWLILTLWGAANWLQIDGRPIEAGSDSDGKNARFDPIVSEDVTFGRDRTRSYTDCLASAVSLPATITEFVFSGHSGHLVLGGHRIAIAESPEDRPVYRGSGASLAFHADDDVAKAWILAPFPWVEV